MLRRCVTSGTFSISDFSFCLPDNAYSKQIFKCIHIIWDSRGWQSKWSVQPVKINPKSQVTQRTNSTCHIESHVQKPPTPERIYDKDAAGAQTPKAAFGRSCGLKSLCRPWHKEQSTEGWCILLTTVKAGGNRIFATMLCPACQNSFVWKPHNGVRQHRPRSRAM